MRKGIALTHIFLIKGGFMVKIIILFLVVIIIVSIINDNRGKL